MNCIGILCRTMTELNIVLSPSIQKGSPMTRSVFNDLTEHCCFLYIKNPGQYLTRNLGWSD